MKKVSAKLSLFLCVMMLISLLASCGSGEAATTTPSSVPTQAPAKESSEPSEEPELAFPLANGNVTMEWWMPMGEDILARLSDFEKNYAWNTLSDLSGIEFEFITPAQTNQAEQFNLMIASEDYPDFIRSNQLYTGGGDKAISDGVFVNLIDLVEKYAPNYQKWRQLTPEIAKTTVTDMGNMYQMQMIFDTRQAVIFGMMLRQDWLDDLGLIMPETVDDWHNVLTQFKAKTTDGYGPMMLGYTGFNTYETFGGSVWGIGGSNEMLSFILKDGKVTYSALQPEFKDYLATMNQWYSEGLIDPDFTTNQTAQKQLVTDGKVGAATMIFVLGGEYWSNVGGDSNAYWSLAPFPVLNKGDKPLHGNLRDQSPPDTGISVSTNCEHPEWAVKVMDYYYSDEGALLANYGIEGVTFDYNKDGKPVLKELISKNPEGMSMSAAQALYLVHSGAMVFMLGREEDTLNEGSLKYKTMWNVSFPRQLPNSLSFTDDESSEKTSIMSDIITYVQEMTCKFIMGTESLDNYDAFVKQVRSMNIDRAIEIYQTSYDRYQKR